MLVRSAAPPTSAPVHVLFVLGLVALFSAAPAVAQEAPLKEQPPIPHAEASSPSAASATTTGPLPVVARSPAQLQELAAEYSALADRGGDPWDALSALLYYERLLEAAPALAPMHANAMARMRQLAGRTPKRTTQPKALYPVHFSAYDFEDDTYQVTVDGKQCATPCTLELPSGGHALSSTGDGEIETEIVVKSEAARVRLQHDLAGQRIAGAVLIPAGVVVGASLWALALLEAREEGIVHLTLWPTLGAAMLVTGIVLVATAPTPPDDANNVLPVALAPLLSPSGAGELKLSGAVGSLQLAF